MSPPTAIHTTLSSLLPSQSRLPPTLISLAESLLAQSRQRASHLKPEEEIARLYACCEIACTRLRVKCRLPAVKSAPPCKPVVYKRLVGFLEGVLKDAATPQKPAATPNATASAGRKRTADGSVKKTLSREELAEAEQQGTPTKARSTPRRRGTEGTFLGSVKATTTKTRGDVQTSSDDQAPPYTMPLIRSLCRTFRTPSLAPHVYTGVCVVLKLAELWPPTEDADMAKTDDSVRQKVMPLTIALFLMVLSQMQSTTPKFSKQQTAKLLSRAVEALEYDGGTHGVAQWVKRINGQRWGIGSEWFGNVPENVVDFDVDSYDEYGDEVDEDEGGGMAMGEEGDGEAEDEDEDYILTSRRRRKIVRTEEDDGDEALDDVLLPGLHTMMQESFMLLSAERTRDFEKWKKAFLTKLDRMDKEAPSKSTVEKDRRRAGRAIAAK